MYSNTVKDKFIELRAQGLALDAISSQIGIPRATLSRWNRLWLGQIQRLRALQWELLEDQIGQRLEDSLHSIAQRIRRLEGQLDTCDITRLTPAQLIRLLRHSRFDYLQIRSVLTAPLRRPCPDPFPDAQNDSIEAMKDRWMMSAPAPQNETSETPVVASPSPEGT